MGAPLAEPVEGSPAQIAPSAAVGTTGEPKGVRGTLAKERGCPDGARPAEADGCEISFADENMRRETGAVRSSNVPQA